MAEVRLGTSHGAVASATLALELVVQIPFLGPSLLQALFGAVAISMTVLAWRAKRAGWWAATLSRELRRGR